MQLLNQPELLKMVSGGAVTGVIAAARGDYFTVVIETNKNAFKFKTQRGGERQFKTLAAVKGMLDEVGIKSFTVVG